MKQILTYLTLLVTCYINAQDCDLPPAYGGLNTGSNMSVLLHQDFLAGLTLSANSPYIVANTQNGLLVGSKSLVDENGELVFQEAVAIWGDDAQTEIIDGAVAGDQISLQIVDGTALYDISTSVITFSVNGISVIGWGTMEYNCTGILFGCNDDSACNFNPDANENDGSCLYPEPYYNCAGDCILDSDNDGVCDELEIYGCPEPMACNYNPEATEAIECIYPIPYYNCDGTCVNDTDGDGICDEFETEGCTNIFACNFLETATNDDGSCIVITAEIFYNQQENILTVETQHDSLNITWLYYDNVIPFEHSDTLHLIEDGVYGVLLYDPINDCGTTDTVHINVVGLNDDMEQEVKLYPNPTSDYLYFELQLSSRITIYNTLGKLLVDQQSRSGKIDVQDWEQGLYFVKVENPKGSTTKPWIKK